MKYECKIIRSCIYWDEDKRETLTCNVEADSLEEAVNELYTESLRLEIRSGSKLVQDALIYNEGVWKSIFNTLAHLRTSNQTAEVE